MEGHTYKKGLDSNHLKGGVKFMVGATGILFNMFNMIL